MSAKGTPRSSRSRARSACAAPAPGKMTAMLSAPSPRSRDTASATCSISSDLEQPTITSARSPEPASPVQSSATGAQLSRGSGASTRRASAPSRACQTSTHSSPALPRNSGSASTTATEALRRARAAMPKNSPQPSAPPARMRSLSATRPGPAGTGASPAASSCRGPSSYPFRPIQAAISPNTSRSSASGKSSDLNPPRIRSSKSPSADSRSLARLFQIRRAGSAGSRGATRASMRLLSKSSWRLRPIPPAWARFFRARLGGRNSTPRRETPSSTHLCLSAWVCPRVGATTIARSSLPRPSSSHGRTTPRHSPSAKRERKRSTPGSVFNLGWHAAIPKSRSLREHVLRGLRLGPRGCVPMDHACLPAPVPRGEVGDGRRLGPRGVARLHGGIITLVQALQAGADGLVAEGLAHGLARCLGGGFRVGHDRGDVRSRPRTQTPRWESRVLSLRCSAVEKILALGPVSRILFHAFRRFGRHFSRALSGPPARLPRGETARRQTDATYPRLLGGPPSLLFCLAPDGVFRAARLAARRGGLLPHLFTLAWRFRGTARRSVLCDTVRRRGLNRDACACLSAQAASCPAVSGLSSPNFYRARRYPRLGIKELGATTRPQS